jgi:hypothetical protein
MSEPGMHDEPVLTGAEFQSLFVLYVRRKGTGGLFGVWYHPNRAAHDRKIEHLSSDHVFKDRFDYEVVEYVRKN